MLVPVLFQPACLCCPLLLLLQDPLPTETQYAGDLWLRIGFMLLAVAASVFLPNRRRGLFQWHGSGFSFSNSHWYDSHRARGADPLQEITQLLDAGRLWREAGPDRAAGLAPAPPASTGLVAAAQTALATDAYQSALQTWLNERGLSPADPEHVALAVQALPYDPVLYRQAVVSPAAAQSLSVAQTWGELPPSNIALAFGLAGPSSAVAPRGPALSPPQQVQELLWLFERPWWIAGGWALELWLGRELRPHADIEIALARSDQLALRSYMTQFRFTQVVAGEGGETSIHPLPADAFVEAPVHELHARRYSGAGLDPLALTSLEVLLNEIEDGVWRYRRDERVTLPVEQIGGTSAQGLSYLVPEVVLLYKAGSRRGLRPVDEQDFAAALPALTPAQRQWLAAALAQAHPGHPWSVQL